MQKNWIRDAWSLVKNFRGHLIWGFIVLFFSLIGLWVGCSDIILVVTALIVFFYTYETYKMRKAITENTEINTRPILTLEIDFGEKKAYIANFSNFPAYNFTIDDYDFETREEHLGKVFKGLLGEEEAIQIDIWEDFRNIDVIPPKDKVIILESRLGAINESFFTNLEPSVFRGKTISFQAIVSYDDILNNTWKMKIGYSDGKVNATKPEKIKRKMIGMGN